MKQLYGILFFMFTLNSFTGTSQTANLKGRIADTLNFLPMMYSSVSLLRNADSILIAHAWTREGGEFSFTAILPDTYLLQITRPTFVDYEERIILTSDRDLGTIALISKVNLLKEVIIREKINSIRIKGDTTEFLVDSFLVNKNASVEDLLKRLPGIQVDKTGRITAQGQAVQKVLVDGEEFFGDDPTIATRNIRADNVETVQVFDKKSDQAAFSGIDDGEKNRTINLKLKDNAKKGYFGKLKAGGGTEKRYENEGMVSSFRDKRKFSLYGALSNTNKTAMNWEDADRYAGGRGNMEYDDNGNMYTYYSNSDENVDFSGSGIPETWYVGTHYSNKFDEDKHAFTLNANRKEMSVRGFDNTDTKYILPDTLYYNKQRTTLNNFRNATSANATYEIRLDSLSAVKIKINGRQGTSRIENIFASENLNGDGVPVNNNSRISTTDGTNEMLTSSLLWSRKFKLKGRSLSIQLSQNYTNNASDGFLRSATNFFNPDGTLASSDVIDQKKTSLAVTQTYGARTTYTEPISKVWFVVADYDVNSTLNESKRNTYSKSGSNEYVMPVDSMSNSLRYDILTSKGGLAMKYVNKKLTLSLGGKASYTDLAQHNEISNSNQYQYFFNLFPAAKLQYKLKNTSALSFDYIGSTRQPTLQQIQPLQDNTNPLNVNMGNPALVQSFRNYLTMNYNYYKPISGSSFYTFANYSFIEDDFTSYDVVDSRGRRLRQTVNVNGNSNGMWYTAYFFKLKGKVWQGMRVGNTLTTYLDRNVNFINGLKNVNNSQRATYGLSLSYEKENRIEMSVAGNWTYNHLSSSIRPDVVTKYWIQKYDVDAEIFLPKRFGVELEAAFNVRQRTSDFDRNLNTIIINGYLTKKFMAKDALVVSAGVMDMLNQNLGFNRVATSNYVTENTYTVLKRYFLFTVTWNFNKGPQG